MDWKKVSKMLPILAIACCSALAAAAPSPKTTEDLADRYAQAILNSRDGQEVDQRLREVDPQIKDRSFVLPPLFDRIARGTANDKHWSALCRDDRWGDGAWHLEMKGSAFDGLAASPGAFAQRYLHGDECALLVLQYAYAWPIEAPEVGGIDCSPSGMAEADRFVHVVRQSIDAITRLGPATSEQKAIRLGILIGVASAMDSTLAPTLNRFRESCKESTE